MTVKDLHEILSDLIEKGNGDYIIIPQIKDSYSISGSDGTFINNLKLNNDAKEYRFPIYIDTPETHNSKITFRKRK